MNFEKITIIFEIISAIFILISYLFEVLQSRNNYNFKEYRSKEDIVERAFYEQFSYDIYKSINSYLFTKINDPRIIKDDNIDMKIDIKLDSYYDCQGVNDDELNEEICQNKIVNNYTCCKAECCSRTNGNNIFCTSYLFNSFSIPQKYRSFHYNDEEILEDPKRRFCTYFNKYSDYIYQSNLTNIRLYQLKYNYKDILLNKSNFLRMSKNSYHNISCGIIDSKFNQLYSSDRDLCPINKIVKSNNIINVEDINDNSYNNYIFFNFYKSDNLIIRNILSEIKPRIYEWEYFINSKTKEKLSNINIKDIDEIINNKYNNISFIYEMQNNIISVNELRDYISFDNKKINEKQNLNLYSNKYVGFENYQALKNFTDLFNENNYYNNSLYKIGNELFPSIESIIIGSFLMFLSLIYIIIFFLSLFNKFKYLRNKVLPVFFILKQILFVSTLGEELGIYLWMTSEFEEININIDSFYKSILEKYNERRFQLLFLLSIILLSFSEFITILGLIFSKNIQKNNNNENFSNNKNNINNTSNININNDINNNNNINNNSNNNNFNNNFDNEAKNNLSIKIVNLSKNNENRQPFDASKDNLKSSENRLLKSQESKNKLTLRNNNNNKKFKKK